MKLSVPYLHKMAALSQCLLDNQRDYLDLLKLLNFSIMPRLFIKETFIK